VTSAAASQSTVATYLYAITRGGTALDLLQTRGVDDEPVRLLDDGELACAVGSVSLDEFGEDALTQNLEDLAWLERVARRHDGVVRAVAQRTATVPLRLAVICRDDESARTRLRALGRRAGELLDRVEGREEWGVKVFAGAVASEAQGTPAASGTAYLQRRRQAVAEREDVVAAARRDAEMVFERLAAHAHAAVRHRPQDQRLSGAAAPMVLNAAFLVDRDKIAEFQSVASEIAAERGPEALVVTGPWPPYSFASLEEE
jgi:hypothetical protein